MSTRQTTVRLITASLTAAVATIAFAGCAGPSSPGQSPTPPVTGAPSPSPTPTDTATGCAATPDASMPTDASSRETIDVDGDGTGDTEWIAQVDGAIRFGVTTASGATFSYDVSTASPTGPAGLVSRLNDTQIMSMLTTGREAFIHTIVDCSFVQPLNPEGQPYTFDLQDLRGNGTGVGCADGSLVGYLATSTDGSSFTVDQTTIELSADGRSASNGATSSLGTGLPSTDPVVVAAQSVTCGDDTMSDAGVALDG